MVDPVRRDAPPLLVLALPGAERLAAALGARLAAPIGGVAVRSFPDRESHVRLDADVAGRLVVLAADLHHPDPKLLPLVFAADAARDLGAAGVGLVAPYLPYMRQDRRFAPGEAITSLSFGRLLSRAVDWLVTVDPHLHRHRSLAEVYGIPTRVVRAAPHMAAWIRANVEAPLLVGPDVESAQWVGDVAARVGAPFTVLEKVRRGDRDVEVSSKDDLAAWRDRTPVLVDDIVSTARTLAQALRWLRAAGLPPAVCVGVHALFEAGAHEALLEQGPARVVTCDTVPHPTNGIALTADLGAAVLELTRPPCA